jgi:hypothetical protein
MPSDDRRIEIFAPFEAALNLTKLILFRPFDLAKWCVIGFAAFLAHLGSARFNYNSRMQHVDWSFRSMTQHAKESLQTMPPWVLPLIVIVVVLALVVGVVLAWVHARGNFIFTDCVVRNRGAIVAPWKEFRREGNSLFLFRLATGLIFMFLFALAALPLWWPLVRTGEMPEGMQVVVGIALLLPLCFISVAWSAVCLFMVPIMYRRRCGAVQGFWGALALCTSRPGPVILFLLFSVVLWIAILLASCLAACVTCCVAAIPYVGTVILLPLHVFWMSYLLLFVRQFGPEYDGWANLIPLDAGAPPIQAEPTVTEPPPPLPPES